MEDYYKMYIKDWFKQWALYTPDKTAIEEYETGRSCSYSDLYYRSRKVQQLFVQWNLNKGDRLMIIAEHSIELIVLFAAATRTGVVLVPVNFRLSSTEIDFLIKDCDPKVLLYDLHFSDKIKSLKEPPVQRYLIQELDGLLSNKKSNVFNNAPVSEEDALFILYTSGTTGQPKGAIYTYRMLFWNSINTSMSLQLTCDDHTINCMPSFHTGGWNVLLTPMLHRGATVGLIKKFDPERILQLLEERRSTVFMGVPTMLKMMKETDAYRKAELNNMRYMVVGGEAMPYALIRSWHNKGVSIRQGYGLTEVGPNITSLHQDDAEKKLGSIGRPNFYVEARLLDEHGIEVEKDQIGELCLKGNMVTPGYWKNDRATRAALIDGWFRTGDLMRMDEEGYLFVVDRKKSMYISGGENVYPAEIEKVLLDIEGIKDAAVIGIPDEKWGETGKAFYVVDGSVKVDINFIQTHCAQKLARFKIPKYFVCIDSLPKNDSGKIDRRALQKLN